MRRVSNARLAIADQHVSQRRAANDFCRPPIGCGPAEQEPNNNCLFKLEIYGLCFIGEIA
jgi:hypothetical protein